MNINDDSVLVLINNLIASERLNKKKSYIIDIGSNDGVALKPFINLGFKNVLGIEPAKNVAKIANSNGLKTLPEYFDKKTVRK